MKGASVLAPILGRARRAGFALACGAALLSTGAGAQTSESASVSAARALGTSGVEAYLDGQYEQATDELEKAYAILRVPSLALWSGRALEKRGRLVEASERYAEAAELRVPTGDAQVQKQAVNEAAAELTKLRPRIPSLTVELVGADTREVVVELDGKLLPAALVGLPRLVNPGHHQVVATRGGQRITATASVAEGQRKSVEVRFAGVSPSARSAPVASVSTNRSPTADSKQTGSSPRKTWAVVALAAGGAGLALGGITGGLAIGKRNELEDTGQCNDGCSPSLGDDVDTLDRYRTLSTIGFVAGGVFAASGVVLLITAPSSGGAQARAELLPNAFAVKGTF
ncbi:MAG TPA: hypothetical protein VEX18_11790 [Polyangiaceae bacterium]|nr:hypothetical protein [Polyangiaceae bacterium]